MKRFDYTHYQELLDSFDYELDDFNPHTEIFEQYVEILEKFDPINNPPEQKDKKEYIINFILPILQEYCRDWKAILELNEKESSVTFYIITNTIRIIKDETDFKAILYYSTSFEIENINDRIKLEIYFSIKWVYGLYTILLI